MQTYGNDFNQHLIEKAKSSDRLRAHQNLHQSYDDPVQRILIALCKGTYVPPHFHQYDHQWELFQVISGKVKLIIFNDDGSVSDVVIMGDGESIYATQLQPNKIHTIVCLSEDAIIFELKQGPFIAEKASSFPEWSENEQGCDRETMVSMLESLEVGSYFRSFSDQTC